MVFHENKSHLYQDIEAPEYPPPPHLNKGQHLYRASTIVSLLFLNKPTYGW